MATATAALNRNRNRSTGLDESTSYADAAALAVATSGRTVLLAGLTVCIALLGQFLLGVSFLYGVSVSAAVAVALTMATARRHVPVAILSNTTSALAADLRLHGLSGAFDAVFTSAALGVAKPAPAAYLAVAAAVGIRPGRIYFTDDEMIHVRGARHAGMMAGQFTSPGQFSATLAGLGLPLAAAGRQRLHAHSGHHRGRHRLPQHRGTAAQRRAPAKRAGRRRRLRRHLHSVRGP